MIVTEIRHKAMYGKKALEITEVSDYQTISFADRPTPEGLKSARHSLRPVRTEGIGQGESVRNALRPLFCRDSSTEVANDARKQIRLAQEEVWGCSLSYRISGPPSGMGQMSLRFTLRWRPTRRLQIVPKAPH